MRARFYSAVREEFQIEIASLIREETVTRSTAYSEYFGQEWQDANHRQLRN